MLFVDRQPRFGKLYTPPMRCPVTEANTERRLRYAVPPHGLPSQTFNRQDDVRFNYAKPRAVGALAKYRQDASVPLG